MAEQTPQLVPFQAADPDAVTQTPAESVDGEEGWQRLTRTPEIRGVDAVKLDGELGGGWQVTVWAMEYVRHVPLERDLRDRIDAALRGVPGVSDVVEEDCEVWAIDGNPSGAELVTAVAAVLDELAHAIAPFTSSQ